MLRPKDFRFAIGAVCTGSIGTSPGGLLPAAATTRQKRGSDHGDVEAVAGRAQGSRGAQSRGVARGSVPRPPMSAVPPPFEPGLRREPAGAPGCRVACWMAPRRDPVRASAPASKSRVASLFSAEQRASQGCRRWSQDRPQEVTIRIRTRSAVARVQSHQEAAAVQCRVARDKELPVVNLEVAHELPR